jgi:general secretion pathway protein J
MAAGPRRRAGQRGMTLIEITVSLAILSIMMVMTWASISSASRAQRETEAGQARNHELRVALAKVAADFAGAYLSKNEDEYASNRRTMMIARPGDDVPDVRFSTLAHRNLWADANESEQTVISYLAVSDREDGRKVNWVRREQRRLSNLAPDEEPAEYDVLIRDIKQVKIEFWDWQDEKWLDSWDTTAADGGQKNRLPLRVRIAVTVLDDRGAEFTVSTQARLLLQEQLYLTTS